MAINDTVQARVTSELKADAEAVFNSMGLKTSDAIRLFLQQSVNIGGLPFQPRAKIPNSDTLEAMREGDHNKAERFKTTEALFANWDE